MANTQQDTQIQQAWMSDFGARYPNSFSYYTGSNISIFVGNKVIMDEAAFISYDLQQNKRPVYGYASQYWDKVATGTVLVQGSLGINYIDNKYLAVLLFDVWQSQQNVKESPAPQLKNKPLDQMSYMAQLSGYNTLTANGKQAFNNAADVLKQQYWGQNTSLKFMPRADTMPPVDIFINYGVNTNGSLGSTTKRLEQVSFVGETQQIEINGQPILEVYSFIARSIKNEITSQNAASSSGTFTY